MKVQIRTLGTVHKFKVQTSCSENDIMKQCSQCVASDLLSSLEPRLSVPDFVSQLPDKIWNGKPRLPVEQSNDFNLNLRN